MKNPAEIVRSFYDKLKVGDAPGALGLMANDIEWLTMWHYKVIGRGPERVAEGLFKPLVAEWSSFALDPSEFIVDRDTVVSLGHFTGVHRSTGKQAEAGYAHVWTVKAAGSCASASTSIRWLSPRRADHESAAGSPVQRRECYPKGPCGG